MRYVDVRFRTPGELTRVQLSTSHATSAPMRYMGRDKTGILSRTWALESRIGIEVEEDAPPTARVGRECRFSSNL